MEKKKSIFGKVFTVTGLVLCVIFAFLLICNFVIIIKGSLKPETPPSVFGITPMVVLSGSMSGDAPDHIEVNDLIFVGKIDADKVKVGDVICFMDGKATVTHRVTMIQNESDGSLSFRTKGDANNSEDQNSVPADKLVGKYRFRIPKVGGFAIFLQTPIGMIIFIGIPLIGFIIYDFLRRSKSVDKEAKKTEELKAEIERLKKLAGESKESLPDETADSTKQDAAEDSTESGQQ